MSNDNLDKKLSTLKYNTDELSHLVVNQQICKECQNKVCSKICPANVYEVDENGELHIFYENCLECGACKIVCSKKNISWSYPKPKFGVKFKHG